MVVPRFYENLKVLHDGVMPARSYYVPASKRMDDPVEQREASDRLQCLNGNWKFRYYESIYDVREAFYAVRYDASDFDEMKVPGVWQMAGYDSHQYSNIRYPFPFDPPFVPHDVPCGAYVHRFNYQKDEDAPKAYLNFEGVDSCFYVWLNEKYIGYSQVSHVTSEFDVTQALVEGENVIAVLVLKWCDGSYLEDQDKFRMSGIFRDVYLLKRPEQAVRDYRVKTKVEAKYARIDLELSFFGQPVETVATVYDQEGEYVASGAIAEENMLEREKISLEVSQAQLWNAERPYLYTLIIETEKETITDYVGFRTIKIEDGVLRLNGQNIKFRGVNRHDSDPVTGAAISMEQLMKDLTMMKQHNFNAIRSSHYPNAPYFYQLCDRYGFMVIDEADMEAHGPVGIYYKEDTDKCRFSRWNEQIANNPAWRDAVMDRIRLMVERDKNRPSILIWSMGNESAYGCIFEEALKWTKGYDPERVTHYESARYHDEDNSYDYSFLDLYSRMYPALEEIKEYLEKDGSKPFLLVEYCHAMGNGPGDLEDYFEAIQADERICGGFIWEWCDHAVAHGKAENGKTKYHYGGDHGEKIHDGNFCMDGLVYPDRTPHTGLLEYKNVYRPARAVSYDAERKAIKIHNYMDFLDFRDYAAIRYEVSCDGVCVETGEIPGFSIAPHGEAQACLDIIVPNTGRAYLKLIYQAAVAMPLVPKGHVLGFDEVLLKNADGRNQTALKWMNRIMNEDEKIDVKENDMSVICKGRGFTYRYDKRKGMFSHICYAGQEYLHHPMECNIWRALTDNDMYAGLEWKRARYDEAYTRAYGFVIWQSKDEVTLCSTMAVLAASVQRMLFMEAKWSIDKNGAISVTMQVKRDMEFPGLPRFGIRLFLGQEFRNVSYYGMGPMESYCDKHRASSHGLYRTTVDKMHEDYIRPQENGSHYDCDYVELSNGRYGLMVASMRPFSFNASVYAQEDLERTAHHYQLQESDSTVLCIDYAMSGMGSNSCGPKLHPQYRLEEETFVFEFMLIPFTKPS